MIAVSVIIPVYNGELYIRETIDSVLQQTFKDLEIIVVDDGSTDKTASIVSGLADRVRLISKANEGTASARNLGIQNSTGEYLQFLDADDLILPSKLTRQVELLNGNPSVDVVYSSFRYFYHDRCDLYAPDWLRPPSSDPYCEIVRGSLFPLHSALVRRNKAETIGLFSTKLISAEDWDFWIRLARSGATFLFHDELLALYRQHSKNKTKRLARWRQAHVQVMENIRSSAESEQELQRINWPYYASSNYVQWALALLLEGDTAQAKEALTTAYVYSPSLGSSPDILSQMITQYALEYDSQGEQQDPAGWGDYIKCLQGILPSAFPAKGVMQSANTLYWRAKAHQAHIAHAGSEVRRCLWRAMRNGGVSQINRGTFSIYFQSYTGSDRWNLLRRLWH